jgi:hypothetical protein
MSPGLYGPFHRRSFVRPEENEAICSSNQLWGRRRENFFAGLIPAVKAWEGPLPDGVVGVEFYTDVPPDRSSVPGWPEWSQGSTGVIVLERDELVAIPVVVTMRHDADRL